MKDRKEGKILCPSLIEKEARREARRLQRKKEQQAMRDARNSGEWLTYERNGPAYKPTNQELRWAAGLAGDARPLHSYADVNKMDEDEDYNQFGALRSDSEDEEKAPVQSERVLEPCQESWLPAETAYLARSTLEEDAYCKELDMEYSQELTDYFKKEQAARHSIAEIEQRLEDVELNTTCTRWCDQMDERDDVREELAAALERLRLLQDSV